MTICSPPTAARPQALTTLINALAGELDTLAKANERIRRVLEPYADNKQLKGNEVVGWMGEVFAKMLLGGTLVEAPDHDLETDGMRVSVKARRKTDGIGWRKTSDIPRRDGDGCPTHLMFLLFSADYRLDKVWFFPWEALHGRFKSKGSKWYVRIRPRDDKPWVFTITRDLPPGGVDG